MADQVYMPVKLPGYLPEDRVVSKLPTLVIQRPDAHAVVADHGIHIHEAE